MGDGFLDPGRGDFEHGKDALNKTGASPLPGLFQPSGTSGIRELVRKLALS
jgi:hypothetical protein